jgi:23S rRNA (guanosine2251-2'-O)-methyltransferase
MSGRRPTGRSSAAGRGGTSRAGTGRPAGGGRSGGGGGRGRTGGRGGSGGGSGAGSPRRTPPTRIKPGFKVPGRLPSKNRQQVRRSGSKARKSVGGEQVEGRQAVRELLIAGKRKVNEVWIVADAEPSPILTDIADLAEGARVAVRDVGRAKFYAKARCESPQGVLAMAAPLDEAELADLTAGPADRAGAPPPFLVALDGVTDPGNLGAVLRSAECAGATGVVLPRHRAAHVTPSATKAAAGAVEHLPIALVGGLPAGLAELRKQGVWLVGLDGASSRSLYELAPQALDAPVCLVFGAEDKGLSRLVRQRCDDVVAIPLEGRLASLNVSAAAALACFEVARARA